MKDVARVAAFAVALLVVVRNVAVGGGLSAAMTVITVATAAAVLAALVSGRDGVVTGSGALLLFQYAAALTTGDVELDLFAPVVGALAVVYVDLADLAASLPGDRRVDRALLARSGRRSLTVLTAGTVAGAAVYAIAAVPFPSAEVVRALGVVGVGLVVVVPLILMRRAQ